MTNKQMIALGKVLFVLSFLFIFTGLYLDFEERESFYDPIKDTVLLAGGGDVIISTTEEVIDNVPSGDDNTTNDGNTLPEKNIPIVEETPPISEEVVPVEPEPVVPVEPEFVAPAIPESTPPSEDVVPSLPETPEVSEEQLKEENSEVITQNYNNNLRKTIEETYGIVVKYGNETDGYKAGTMQAVSITDINVIKSGLEQLNEALLLYPKDFFREFGDENLNLKVYLIQRYSTANVTGITELYGNNVTISISMDYSFAESFHHETYHYIEHYIERMGGEFSIWNTYNPSGFVYGGDPNPNLSFNRTWDATVPFVNNYAQSDADEDRASTFEYMTASSKAVCYNSTEYPIWKKSSYMALMIDTYFDTVDSSVIDYWERFIY